MYVCVYIYIYIILYYYYHDYHSLVLIANSSMIRYYYYHYHYHYYYSLLLITNTAIRSPPGLTNTKYSGAILRDRLLTPHFKLLGPNLALFSKMFI